MSLKPHYRLAAWSILWLIAWGAMLGLWGEDPWLAARPVPLLAIILVATVAAALLFRRESKRWLARLSREQALAILGVAALFVFLDTRPWLDGLVTSAHVLFQQSMIAHLIEVGSGRSNPERTYSSYWNVFWFYGMSHILLALFMPILGALAITALSILGGAFFVRLITRTKYGILLSYALHLAFYAALLHAVL